MEGRNSYAVDTVFRFVASITDRSPGFVERFHSTGMNAFYAEMIEEMLFDHNGRGSTAGELTSLRSGISKFKTIFRERWRHTAHLVYLH